MSGFQLKVGAAFLAILGLVANPALSNAQSMDTPATHAILIDAQTGSVLFEKNADTPFPPASMSKLMTIYVAFEMIKEGIVELDDTTTVSVDTWRKWRLQGSTMFLNARDEITIADLLRGIIVQSGNDACVVLAEALAGSESTFIDWMNIKADELGLKGSVFKNTNGWPDPEHVMTARDLGILAQLLANDFPDLYPIFAEGSYTYGIDPTTGLPIIQPNRNPILGSVEGADGLKTGHTDASGYGLTGSALREGRRLILVASGLASSRARKRESQRLLEYGFRNFKTYNLLTKGQVIEEVNVWLGNAPKTPLVVSEDLQLTLGRLQRNKMKVTLTYEDPIPAPITIGQPLATLRIEIPNKKDIIVPLVAGKSIDEISGLGKISAAFSYLLFGSAVF